MFMMLTGSFYFQQFTLKIGVVLLEAVVRLLKGSYSDVLCEELAKFFFRSHVMLSWANATEAVIGEF